VGTSRKARNDGDEEALAVENAAKITRLEPSYTLPEIRYNSPVYEEKG
jgi:hypothetical protein